MMNEQRINELAIQAGGIWRGGYVEQSNGDSVYTERKSVDMVDMDLNKYTKLVVKECAEFVLFKAEKAMSQEIVAVCDDLLKHFGVEE